MQESAVHVGAQGPYATVVTCDHLGATTTFAVEKHFAMLAPGKGAVGVDLDHPVMGIGGTEHADHPAFDGCQSITWRPGGKVGCGDMDAIGWPLRNAFVIKPLHPWRPSVVGTIEPLYIGVARSRIVRNEHFTSSSRAVGDECIGSRVVDPLGF